ncbi:hypothetical protein A7E78_09735 [Syntrophotalea acetylenivorans]|uniref:PAS domain S-box protein n=1 Tax=Syntrophotalea acetylenivorans TaxID=1842532 RepID=A0A1L3GQ69_9BACT|nr:PAS domain S-box protein [Syntrophotalea acetylenivorans]APG28096.1 hypothetical protein A7E78_09735 [Syntrophotalea acetylenivorans]
MVLYIEGSDQDQQAARTLLQEHGFTVSLSRGEVPVATELVETTEEDLPLAFLAHFIDGIVIMNVETAGVLYANNAFAEMLGYSLEEVRRQKVWDWDVVWSREEIEHMYATRKWLGERFETRFRRKGGQMLDVAVTHKPVTWKGKEVLFCVVRDISEGKQTERVLHLTQFTVENTDDQAFWMSPEGRFLYVNEAACTALDYSREELEGMPIWEIDPNVTADKAVDYWRQLKEEGSMRFESLHRAKDGRIYPVEVRGNYVNYDGQEYSCVFVTDISKRKQEEQALRLNQFAVDNTAEQAFWITPEGQITYANNAACASLGYCREELVGMSLPDIDPDFSGEDVVESWISLKKDKVRRFERCHKAKDGRLYPVEVRSNYVNYDGREFRFAFVIDISERKAAEEALWRREEQYRQLMEMLPIAAYTTDAEGRITFFNRRAQEFWQREPRLGSDLWCGSHMLRYLDGPPMDHDQCPMALTLKTGQACQGKEIIVEHPDGTRSNVIVYPELLADTAGETEGAVNLLVDITERRQTEEALRESEHKYRTIVEHAPFGITRSTREGELLNANPAFASILGYDSVQELLESVNLSNIQDALFPEPSTRAPLVENILSSDSWYVFNNLFYCKDGSLVTCRVHSRRIMNGDGRADEFESFIENITDQLEAMRALRESEEKFRVLAETSSVPITIYQEDRFVYVNPAMEQLLGYSAEELYRMKFWEWAQGEVREQIRNNGLERLSGKTVSGQYEISYLTKGGEQRCVLISAGVMEYQGLPTGVASLLDITERKRSEELLRASLAEKEVLLQEIHHRVKNNLQVVSSLLFLQAQRFSDPELQACFLESQSRICSMALAHEQLYQSKNLSEISIKKYMENLVGQLEKSFQSPKQEVDCRLVVENVPLDIEKVVPCGLLVTELLSNAYKHAFADGCSGQVTVSLQSENGQIELKVVDDGIGLPAEFDHRQAKTLGLQLVSALVNQLGGALEVETVNGTCFRVNFAG